MMIKILQDMEIIPEVLLKLLHLRPGNNHKSQQKVAEKNIIFFKSINFNDKRTSSLPGRRREPA